MKSLRLPLIALCAVVPSVALAADLPTRKEPMAAPAPAPLWKGFYVGVNAGGTWTNKNGSVSTWPVGSEASRNPGYWILSNGSSSAGPLGGFIGGGQVGYSWQAEFKGMGFVTGVEADIQGLAPGGGTRTVNTIFPGATPGDSVWNSTKGTGALQYLGTVRGRIGYLLTPTVLAYGTGGVAYGGVSYNATTNSIERNGGVNNWIAIGNTHNNTTMVGYTIGGGLEWMLMPNWSVKAEYLYYNLGKMNSTTVSTLSPIAETAVANQVYRVSTLSRNMNGNLFRAGVNYHFDLSSPPVIVK